MMDAIDLKFQGDRGLRYLVGAEVFDLFMGFSPFGIRLRHVRATPRSYLKASGRMLGLKWMGRPQGLSATRMGLDPEVMTDPGTWTYNRIVKDGMVAAKHERSTALLIHLRKSS